MEVANELRPCVEGRPSIATSFIPLLCWACKGMMPFCFSMRCAWQALPCCHPCATPTLPWASFHYGPACMPTGVRLTTFTCDHLAMSCTMLPAAARLLCCPVKLMNCLRSEHFILGYA